MESGYCDITSLVSKAEGTNRRQIVSRIHGHNIATHGCDLLSDHINLIAYAKYLDYMD